MLKSNEKYLVSKMEERNKTIVKLKASLYSFTIDELVIKAIDEYVGTVKNMTCSYCLEETVVSRKKQKECRHSVADNEHVIFVSNYPINICRVCGAEFDDMNLSIYLNQLIRFLILEKLRSRESIPSNLDFNELIKMTI